jgi:hypothetical protein
MAHVKEEGDVNDVCTTLFEVYLHESRAAGKEERRMWEEKAKTLLTERKVAAQSRY